MRKAALASRNTLDDAQRVTASATICDRIIQSHEFRSARTIACYLPTANEVDPTQVIERAWRANKRVFVPVTDAHGTMNFCEVTPTSVVTQNDFGIFEPVAGLFVDAKTLDLVITPLVAFDDDNNRIGMGGGYYDRCFHFLGKRRKWLKPKLIGVAFACQKVEKIASDTWDIPLYRVVTEDA